jgi:hypothetical protein
VEVLKDAYLKGAVGLEFERTDATLGPGQPELRLFEGLVKRRKTKDGSGQGRDC